jgi:hypothetical protein
VVLVVLVVLVSAGFGTPKVPIINQPGSSGGGGPAAGTYLPVGNHTGVTVDTTTYSDPIAGGGAKLATLVFPADASALALAISGDLFPRIIFGVDPTDFGVVMFGDGSYDPTGNKGGGVNVGTKNADSSVQATLYGAAFSAITTGIKSAHVAEYNASTPPFAVSGASGAKLSSGMPDPNVGQGGDVGDLYIGLSGGVLSTIWRCTVAGAGGAATWVGIV